MIRNSIFLVALLFSHSVYAVLGGDVASVAKTSRSMPGRVSKSSVQKTGNDIYTYEELETEGIKVREYASSSGKIFAVSWRGVSEPDLSVLLGKYFPDYKTESEKQPATRARHKRVETGEIIVRRSGHMRDMRGVAFVPELVPAGVDTGALE